MHVFKYEPDLPFSNTELSALNKITLLAVRQGIPITVIMYYCMCTCFLSVRIKMNEQLVPSAVAQRISALRLNF